MRVNRPMKDCRIVVRQDGVEIAAKKMKKAIPAEMIQMEIKPEKLKTSGNLEVCGMMREFTCIICPNGCEIRAEIEEKEGGAVEILSIEGAACKKGNAYVEQELKDPQRNIATSVLVKGGSFP